MKYSLTGLIFIISVAISLTACGRHEAPVPAAEVKSPAPTAMPLPFAPYASPASPLAPGGNCALDSVDGKQSNGASLKTGSTVRFAGWMGDARGQVPSQAQLILQGESKSYSVAIVGGGLRTDVVAALNAPGLATAGYNSDVTLTEVAPGSYKVHIVNGGPVPQFCDLKVTVSIVP